MVRGLELDPQLRSRICELRSIGWSYNKIHQKHPTISKSTIITTCRREANQVNNVSRPRSGKPRKLPEEQHDHLYDIVTHQNPYITTKDLLAEVDNVVVAIVTIEGRIPNRG
jgi:transposase